MKKSKILGICVLSCLLCATGALVGTSQYNQFFSVVNGTDPVEVTLNNSNKVTTNDYFDSSTSLARKTIQAGSCKQSITFRITSSVLQDTDKDGFIKFKDGGELEKVIYENNEWKSDTSIGLNSIVISYRCAKKDNSCKFELYCDDSGEYTKVVDTSDECTLSKNQTYEFKNVSGSYFKLKAIASGSTAVLSSLVINYKCKL